MQGWDLELNKLGNGVSGNKCNLENAIENVIETSFTHAEGQSEATKHLY